MSDFPIYTGCRLVTEGEDAANSRGTQFYTSATGHTKGLWYTICTTIPENVVGFWLALGYTDTYRYLLDVGVGADGVEQVVVSNFAWSAAYGLTTAPTYFPLALPAGEKLKLRMQSGSGSQRYCYGQVTFVQAPFSLQPGLQAAITLGADTGTSLGTALDPGGVANTKGDWVELSAATAADIRSLIVCLENGSTNFPESYAAQNWLVDIGVGAAESEQVIVANIPAGCHPSGDSIAMPIFGPVPVFIPEGTRVAMRAQCDITDATDRIIRAVLIGMR